MGQLDGQTAIITGGGTGIGQVIARHFHAAGAFVVVCGRRPELLQQATAEIASDGQRVLALPADITREDDVRRMVAETLEHTGRIDVLVNNAAAHRVNKPPEETSLAEWKSVIDTNVTGTWLCTREVGRVMIERRYGRIINIGSMSGMIVNKFFHAGSYEVSKSAVLMLTKTFAVEWAPYNIKVNAIAPGYYDTQPNRDFFINTRPELYEQILDLIPAHKLGDLEELGRLALYLASPDVDYMTGTTITIDGGYTAW
jgi:NAD(P)-dependent dehydrogenase (short-subunit alcohol dehydrogenase family)